MKNLFKYFVPVTAAVIALSACTQEQQVADQTPDEGTALHITVKATPDDLQGDAATKTYIDGTTIKWGTGEFMKIGVFDGEATAFGNSTDETADGWNGSTEAYFNFSITPANATGDYTYYGLYPSSAAVTSSNTNPASYKVNLPATQNATSASYDPKAYILVAQPESGKSEANADWVASFRRATALNKITLKNIPEDIKRVTITAPTGVYLAGARHINLTTGESGEIYSGGGRTETVEVNYTTKLTGGANMDVWFTSWDAEIEVGSNLTIVAVSNDHIYTRAITVVNKSITFKEGFLNTLSVNMADANVSDNDELEDGDYVILAKNDANYYAMKAETNGNRLVSVDYTGSTSSYNGDADLIWTVTNTGGGFTIENDSKYVGYKGSSNEAYWLASDGAWGTGGYSLNIVKSGTVWNIKYEDRYLSRNTSSEIFAFYGNTNQYEEIIFVPATVDARDVVTLSFVDGEQNATDAVALTTSTYDSFLGLDLVASPNVAAITSSISWTYEDNDGVINEFDDGALTLTGNTGTATVTASFAGDGNYRPAEASYTITVSDAGSGVDYSTIYTTGNDVDVAVSSGGTNYHVTIASTTYDAVKANKAATFTITIPAGTSTLHLFIAAWNGEGSNVTVTGGTISNATIVADSAIAGSGTTYELNGTVSDYYRTITPTSSETTTITIALAANKRAVIWGVNAEAGTPTVATPTFSIVGSDVSIACSTDGATIYYTVDGTTPSAQSSVYSAAISLLGSQQKTIKAFATKNDYEDSEVAAKTYYAVNVDATENGTVTAQPFAAEGDVVSLTVTPYSGYTLDALSVTDSGDNAVSVSSNQFTMPASPVTVSATFASGVQPNDGSLEHPYTVAEALNIISGYSDKEKSATQVYVSGIIANVGSYNSTYNSVTYDISDDGQNSNTLNVYSGKFVANTNFSSNEQIEAGDVVIVYGYLYLYGSTKEMYQNNYIYSLNGITTLPTITKTDITGVDAAGVNNATKAVSFANNDGWTASVTADGTIVTSASISGTTITYSVAANSGDARTGSIIVALSKSGRAYVSATISVSQLAGNGNTSTTETITSGTFSGDTNSLSMTTASGITISQLKNNGTNCNTTYNTVSTLRVYRANQMQFTGKTFTKIEMYYTGSYSGADWTVVAGGGTVSIDTSNKKVVWTNTNGASTVTLQNSTSSGTNTQLRTTQFYFEY